MSPHGDIIKVARQYDDCLRKGVNAAVELQGRSRQQQLSPGDDGHDRTMAVSGNVCRVVSTEFEWGGNCSSFRLGVSLMLSLRSRLSTKIFVDSTNAFVVWCRNEIAGAAKTDGFRTRNSARLVDPWPFDRP